MGYPLKRIGAQESFRILSFTDLHLSGNEACNRWTLQLMEETVRQQAPDLIVFVGDNVTGGDNEARARDFAHRMTRLGVAWCPIPGNHEGDNPSSVSRVEMMRIFRTSPNCLLPSSGAVREEGIGAFAIPLLRTDGSAYCTLFFMDCGKNLDAKEKQAFGLSPEARRSEAPLSSEQVAWYRAYAARVKTPTVMFSHVPLREYEAACTMGSLLFGKRRERVCCSFAPCEMFAALQENARGATFVAGHDHINDFDAIYHGVRLIYNRMSGLDSYNAISKHAEDHLLQGATVYRIDSDGMLFREDVFYEVCYPQYMEEIYRVIRK